MNDWLDYVIFFFGSGLAFLVGIVFVLVGVALSLPVHRRVLSLVRNLVVLVGGLLVAISATPLEWWLYGLMAIVVFVWLPLEWGKDSVPPKWVVAARCATVAVLMLASALELPYRVMPALPALESPTFFLIGDSISAGLSEGDKETWPKRLAGQHRVTVRDYSRMGATVQSARKQAEKLGHAKGLVMLEIGGNDLLGSTSAEEFEQQLDLLLADVCNGERTVVLLGLPLPPFANRFGLAQRRLARKYEVILIPQHVLANVLTTPGATVDGIHLTPRGHQQMADTIWSIIGSAY